MHGLEKDTKRALLVLYKASADDGNMPAKFALGRYLLWHSGRTLFLSLSFSPSPAVSLSFSLFRLSVVQWLVLLGSMRRACMACLETWQKQWSSGA